MHDYGSYDWDRRHRMPNDGCHIRSTNKLTGQLKTSFITTQSEVL